MSLSGDEMRARMERALRYAGDTHTLADVAALVKEGRAQFWGNGDGTIVTEIHTFPRRRAVNYWLVAGGLRSCLDLQPEIDAWAIEQGCDIATACGRRGWGRALVSSGWTEWFPNFQKELNHG
jgi:hypothetical protein